MNYSGRTLDCFCPGEKAAVDSIDDGLSIDTSLAAALETLDRHGVQSWPVIEDDHLLGMVRRTDIYALMRR